MNTRYAIKLILNTAVILLAISACLYLADYGDHNGEILLAVVASYFIIYSAASWVKDNY